MPSFYLFFFFLLSWQIKEKTCSLCHYCTGVECFLPYSCLIARTPKNANAKKREEWSKTDCVCECSTYIVPKKIVFRKFCHKVKAGGELGELNWPFFRLVVYFAWIFDCSGSEHTVSRSVWFSGYSNPVQKLLHVTLDKIGNGYHNFIEVSIFYSHWISFLVSHNVIIRCVFI